MWKPKNWERFRPELLEATEEEHQVYDRGVKAGADAILEALKEEGTKGYMPGQGTGWHCFIPDEKP